MEQSLINWVAALCGALGGWVLKILWDAIQDLKADMHQIERDLPEIYVRKDDWREDMHALKSDIAHRFDKLEDNLNNVFKYIDWRINDKQP